METGGCIMRLKEEFIQKVRENEMTEQPTPNVVYMDSDLEEVICIEMGAKYKVSENKFTLYRGEEKVELKVEHIENRFGSDVEETLITLE